MTLVGKIHRELRRGRPSHQAIKKFETLAQTQLQDRPSKKQRTARRTGDMAWEWHGVTDPDPDANSVIVLPHA